MQWLLKPQLVQCKPLRTPPDNTPRDVDVAVSIDAGGMRADFWLALSRLSGAPRD